MKTPKQELLDTLRVSIELLRQRREALKKAYKDVNNCILNFKNWSNYECLDSVGDMTLDILSNEIKKMNDKMARLRRIKTEVLHDL